MTIETVEDSNVMLYLRKGGMIEAKGVDDKYKALLANSLIMLGSENFQKADKDKQYALLEAIRYFDGKSPTALITASLDIGILDKYETDKNICLIDNQIYNCGDYVIPLVMGREQFHDSVDKVLQVILNSLGEAMQEVFAEQRAAKAQEPVKKDEEPEFIATDAQAPAGMDQFSPVVALYGEKSHAIILVVLEPVFPVKDIDPLYMAGMELFLKTAHEACRRVTTNAITNIGNFIAAQLAKQAQEGKPQ